MFEITDAPEQKPFTFFSVNMEHLTDSEKDFLFMHEKLHEQTMRLRRETSLDTAITMEAVERFLACLK